MPVTVQHSLTMTSPDDPLFENKPSDWNKSHLLSLSLSASEFKYSTLNTGAQFDDGQEVHDLTRAAGHLDGGAITDAGSGNIAVAAGQGFIRAVNNDTSTLFTFAWPAPANIVIPSNTIRYVRVDYNLGTPVVTVSASEDYDYRTGFPLGFVVNEAGTLYINDTPHSIGRGIGRLSRRNYEVDGRSRANALGGLIISESGTAKTVAMTAGVTWLRGIRDSISAFDSNAGGTFDRYYRAATPPNFTREATQTVVPDGLWDDGDGTLATIGNNNYANYWFYIGPAGSVVMVYGRGDFNSLAAAQAESPPSTLPLRLQVGSLLLGRFILRRTGGTNYDIVLVESAFTNTFTGTGVSDHGLLSGLADDDHPQYHLTSLGVIRQISASTQAVTSGSISFANSHGVSFGMNNGTLTASITPAGGAQTGISGVGVSDTTYTSGTVIFSNQANVTIGSSVDGASQYLRFSVGAGGGDAIRGIAAGGSTASTSTVLFDNANGLSFGFGAAGNSTNITGSYTVPVSSDGILDVSTATAAGTATSRFAMHDHQHRGIRAINAIGTASTFFGNLALSGAGQVVLATAGNTTAGSIQISVPAQTVQPVAASAANGVVNFSTLSFSNVNNVSFVTAAGPAIQASIPAGATATGNLGAVAGSNTTYTSGTVVFSGVGGGATVSSAAGRIDISVAAPVAQTNQTGGIYVTNQSTGQSSSSTYDLRTLSFIPDGIISAGWSAGSFRVSATQSNQALSGQNGSFTFQTASFSNANGISIGTSAGPAITFSHNALTTAALSNHSHGASASNGSFAFQTINFSNANNVTFGTSAGGIVTASVAAGGGGAFTGGMSNIGNTAGTSGTVSSQMLVVGGPNITVSQSINGQSATLSISGNAPGAAAENNWHTLSNVAPGANSSASGSTIGLSGLNLTLSGTNNSQIILSVPATSSLSNNGGVIIGTTGSTIGLQIEPEIRYVNEPAISTYNSQVNASQVSLVPLQIPFRLAFSNIRFGMNLSGATTTLTSSAWGYFSASAVLYSRNVSTLESIVSGSNTWAGFYQSNSVTQTYGGARGFTINMNVPTTIGKGEYWLAMHMSTTNTGSVGGATTALAKSHSFAVGAGASLLYGLDPFFVATQATRGASLGLGIISTGATRATLALSAISQTGTQALNAKLWLDLRNYSIW